MRFVIIKRMTPHQHTGRLMVGVCSVLMYIMLGFSVTHAQTAAAAPQFFVTWRAIGSYAPAEYLGKILPDQTSQVIASLEIVANGKVIPLSRQIIYWYLDDTLIGGGVGAQSIVFHPFGDAPNNLELKASLPNYPGGALHYQISIPLVKPLAIIYAPYPNDTFSSNQATVEALPYFFDATSSALGYLWTVNGEDVLNSENPQTLQISVPQGTPDGSNIAIALAIHASLPLLNSFGSTNLVYQKSL